MASRKYRFRPFVATLALLVVMTGLSVAHATDDQNQRDREFGAPGWQDPAMHVLPDLDSLMHKVRLAFGSRFAGAWLNRPSDVSLRDSVVGLSIAIVGATESDRASISTMAAGNRFVGVVSAKYGLASLESWKEILSDYLFAAGAERVMVDADEQANVVTVTMTSPQQGLAAHARANGIPEDAWQLISAKAPQPIPRHSSRAGAYPYEAGLTGTMRSAGGTTRGLCTTWFMTKTSIGNYKGATAGHCESASTDHMWLGSNDLGDGALNSYLNQARTNSDAVRYSVSIAQATNRVLYTTPNNHYPTKTRFYVSTNGGLPMNTYLCFAGITSGTVCGFVDLVNFSIQDTDGVWHDNTWRMDATSADGDSGAPVFQLQSGTAKAAGLLTGGETSNTYFHHVSYVMEDLQTTLYTG